MASLDDLFKDDDKPRRSDDSAPIKRNGGSRVSDNTGTKILAACFWPIKSWNNFVLIITVCLLWRFALFPGLIMGVIYGEASDVNPLQSFGAVIHRGGLGVLTESKPSAQGLQRTLNSGFKSGTACNGGKYTVDNLGNVVCN